MRFVLLVALLAAPTTAQTARPTIAATTVPTAPVEMDRESLLALDRAELGNHFDASQTEALLQAQALIEDYFDKPTERKQIVQALESTGIDPNFLGRLARVRTHWPDLKGGVYYVNERV